MLINLKIPFSTISKNRVPGILTRFRVIDLFGYVRPQRSELLVREFESYRGVYCELCRRLGKDYGPPARLVLNYDCTFYAAVRIAVSGGAAPPLCRGRCTVNPLKRCGFCAESGDEFAAASALTVILAYYKVKDDIADSGFFKGLLYRAALPLFSHMHRKAVKRFPELEKAAGGAMKGQAQAEQAGGIDRAAEPTAHMLADVFELVGASVGRKRILRETGYFLGRWIYLMDAADDLAKDLRRQNFNPFAVKFHLGRGSAPEELKQARDYANEELNGTLAKLCAAVNLLEMNSFGPIVRNIVFLGLPMMQKELLYKKESGNVRSV